MNINRLYFIVFIASVALLMVQCGGGGGGGSSPSQAPASTPAVALPGGDQGGDQGAAPMVASITSELTPLAGEEGDYDVSLHSADESEKIADFVKQPTGEYKVSINSIVPGHYLLVATKVGSADIVLKAPVKVVAENVTADLNSVSTVAVEMADMVGSRLSIGPRRLAVRDLVAVGVSADDLQNLIIEFRNVDQDVDFSGAENVFTKTYNYINSALAN